MKDLEKCSYEDKDSGYGLKSLVDSMWVRVPDKIEKSKYIRCPKCNRRLKSKVRYCHDGCCISHLIPPHKKKGWWKKKIKMKRKKNGIKRIQKKQR